MSLTRVGRQVDIAMLCRPKLLCELSAYLSELTCRNTDTKVSIFSQPAHNMHLKLKVSYTIVVIICTVKVQHSRYRPCRPRGVQEVKAPRFLDNGTVWWQVVSLTHRPPLPPEIFLVLIFTRGCVDPRAMVWSEGNMSLKKSSDTTGNRSRDRPSSSAAP